MTVTWTILIPTIGRRAASFHRLVGELLPQVEPHPGVSVLALWNNGERPLGVVRQALVEAADSEYISFVDDDDHVPGYYVDEVVAAIELAPEPPDQVGWRMQCIADGNALKPTFHSVRYTGWYDDDAGYYRDHSHLNPVKRELALRVNFQRGDPPEDVSWATQVRGLIHSEVMIDESKIMYYYHASSGDSTWRPGSVTAEGHARVEVEHPRFRYHPWSYV